MALEKWTPERRMERTRAALIESAHHVFATRGFEGASLDEIAETAGYTRGAIYKHFANKEDLFFAVVNTFNDQVLRSFAEQLELDASAAFDTQQIAATWIKALTGHKEMWALGVEFSLYEFRNPTVRQRSLAWRRQNRATIAEFIEKHSAETGIALKVPAETIAAMLLTASDGFVQAARVDPDAEGLFSTFLDLFLPALVDAPASQAEHTRAAKTGSPR